MARPGTAQLDWLFPSWLLIDGIFFGQRGSAGPSCPAPAGGQKDETGRRGTAVPFSNPTLLRQFQGSSGLLPGSTPGPRDGSHACGSHSWREVKHFKPLLWLWKGIVNPQLASGFEYGVKSMQCLPVRHKRIKLPVGFF